MKYSVTLPGSNMLEAWRHAARIAISHKIPPAEIDWTGEANLFATAPLPDMIGTHQAKVPQAFLKLASSVIWHSAPEKAALLYEALWRLDAGPGQPLSQADPLGRRLGLLAKSVGRDIHKMHAFLRFREVPHTGRRRFAAWFEPDHAILEPASRFFVKRFADMDWIIITPRLTAHFENGNLCFSAGGARPELPEDASEALWGTYFANIFNPARIKLNAMRSEMPKKYWKNLPETRLIPAMLKDAEARVERMQQAAASTPRRGAARISTRYREAMPIAPEMPQDLWQARDAAMQCQRCGLCQTATQTVWGEGSEDARLMLVGEQPGDHEDLNGRPFIGPAGQVLHKTLADAGIEPEEIWLTNAVKHFKFQPRGKLRLHQSPDKSEIIQCRWWLGMELAFIRPEMVIALGATAAFALTGNDGRLGARRGKIETALSGQPVMISWHPSYILRLPDNQLKSRARAELVSDLAQARSLLGKPA